ncbi:MAG: hypothetical protein B6D62_00020 [Candidatus Cloacimonas sp. 4484_275]|nr:MAG: hypothetical protein B6D62_00020 [Candidatus Cloacimonas sp. 4484_275]
MEKKKILIVEDERIIAEDIKVSLKKLDYEIIGIVTTGEEAIEKAGKLKPDLILMDILLETAMDGIEAAERIQKDYDIPVIFLTAHAEGIIREISYSIEGIIGFKREQLLGKSIFDFFQTSQERFLYELKIENQINEFEVNLKDRDNNIIPCSINAKLFRDENGRPEKIIGSLRNITKRKLAEEQAKRLAEEWKVTFDSINDLVAIQDNDFNIVRVNKAVLDAFKKRPEEVIGKKCYEFFHNSNNPLPNCPFKKAKEQGKAITDEFYVPVLNKTFEVSTSPIYDNEKNFIGVVHLAKDITEKKSIERTLLELKKAIETMQLGVTITNIDGKIIYTNATEASMHGYTVEELIGKDVGIFSPSELRNPLTVNEIKNLRGWIRESTNVKKDGTKFPVRLMSDVVRDNDGKIIGVVTTCEDLTEHKGQEKRKRCGNIFSVFLAETSRNR